MSPLQKRPGSYQLVGASALQHAHLLERHGDHLGAVGVLGAQPLALGLAARQVAVAPAQPAPGQPHRARERHPVQPRDGLEHGILLLAPDVRAELAQPGPLAVAPLPRRHRLAQVVQLHAAVVVAGPVVAQRLAELGVPHQGRQVVEHHGHAHVVHRGVARGLDRPVGHRAAAEQPEVPRAGRVDGLLEGDGARTGARHGPSVPNRAAAAPIRAGAARPTVIRCARGAGGGDSPCRPWPAPTPCCSGSTSTTRPAASASRSTAPTTPRARRAGCAG